MLVTTNIEVGKLMEFHEAADFFRLMRADFPVNIYYYDAGKEVARADGVSGGYAERFAGQFQKIAIETYETQTIQFAMRLGNVVNYDTPPTGAVTVGNTSGEFNTSDSVVDGSVTEIKPAGVGSRYVLIQNNSDSDVLRVAFGSSPSSSSGLRIQPDGYWESPAMFATTQAIRAISESGMAIDVVVVWGD